MKKLLTTLVILIGFVTLLKAQSPSEKTGPDTVKIGAYVISLHDINFHDKEYTMRFWLWLLHNNKEFDLIAIGRPFIANPDLVARLQKSQNINRYEVSMLNELY